MPTPLSCSALRNTKDRLQSGITLKSNLEQSQVTYIVILRSWESAKVHWTAKELKPTLNKQSDSIHAKLFIKFFFFIVFYYFNTDILALVFTYFIVGHSRALILYLSYVYFIRFFLQLENDRREIEISFFIASFYSEMCFKKLLIRHRMKRKRLSSYNIETTPVVFWGLAEICVKLQFVSSLKFFYYQPFSRPFHCGRHWTFKQTNKQTKKLWTEHLIKCCGLLVFW